MLVDLSFIMHTHKGLAEICMLVQNLDVKNEDSICTAVKMKNIMLKLKSEVKDEKQLRWGENLPNCVKSFDIFFFSELFDILNSKALEDGEDFILAFVTVVTSIQCSNFHVNGNQTLRRRMMSLCQKNFQNCTILKFPMTVITYDVYFSGQPKTWKPKQILQLLWTSWTFLQQSSPSKWIACKHFGPITA